MTSRTRQSQLYDCSTSTIFIDESGAAATGSSFFVMAGIKVRRPGLLGRSVREVRDRTGFERELKFSEITRASVYVYSELITALETSDAHIAACVVQGKGPSDWRAHARIISRLLRGSINTGERVGVLMDAISTPVASSLEDTVRAITNSRMNTQAVVSAVALDSKSNDVLQLADMVAGSILHERRRSAAGETGPRSNKGRVALKLATAFEAPGLADAREGRVRIETITPQSGRKPRRPARLKAV